MLDLAYSPWSVARPGQQRSNDVARDVLVREPFSLGGIVVRRQREEACEAGSTSFVVFVDVPEWRNSLTRAPRKCMPERVCGFEFHFGHGRNRVDSAGYGTSLSSTCEVHVGLGRHQSPRPISVGGLCATGPGARDDAPTVQQVALPEHLRRAGVLDDRDDSLARIDEPNERNCRHSVVVELFAEPRARFTRRMKSGKWPCGANGPNQR
jgi:hypothetical protein